jgi:hypothetical protein
MISQVNGTVIRKPKTGKISFGKQIVYRFNGDPKDDETVSDRTGTLPFRTVGEIITRKGKAWRVTIVRDDLNMSASRTAVSIHHVFLTDNF